MNSSRNSFHSDVYLQVFSFLLFSVTPEAKNLAEIYSCQFYEISTALNHRVDELLVGIIAEIKERHLEVDRERDRLDRMATTKKRGSSSHPGHRRSFVLPKSTANSVVKFFQKHFSRKEQKNTHNPFWLIVPKWPTNFAQRALLLVSAAANHCFHLHSMIW